MEKREIKKQGAIYDGDGNVLGEVTVETIEYDDGHKDAIIHVPELAIKMKTPGEG